MRRIRVYADTSVFGGAVDEEFSQSSRPFFERLGRGEFVLLVSTETLRELSSAPTMVREVLQRIAEEYMESVSVGTEVEALAEAYMSAGILGRASRSDAIHVAAATVAEADLIVSWNFRHIVNLDRIAKYNAVNVLNGYRPIEIRSPAEVAYGNQT